MPSIWKEFVNLENEKNLANYKYNVFGKTLHEIDELIELEKSQMSIFDFI